MQYWLLALAILKKLKFMGEKMKKKIRLGDYCNPSLGQIKEDDDTLIDYIDISSVDNVSKKIIGYQTMTFGSSPSRARKAVKKGNILISTVRPNLNAVAMLEEETPNVSVASTGFCVLDCKPNVNSRFILNFCQSKSFIDDMVSQATGASYPAVSEKIVRSALVPEYSYEEQSKIGKIFDAIADIIENREQQLEKLDLLVKSRFVELFGDLSTNPKGYPVKVLPEIAEYWNGLTYKPEDVSDEGTIVLRSSNIQNAALDFADTVRVSCKIGEKKYVQNNDILMCSRNGSARLVGKVALIKDIGEQMSFGAFMMIIRSVYNPYLMTYFQMPAFRAQITTGATTTINQITGRMLDVVKLPVPDMDTIKQFDDFAKQVDKSKFAIKKSLEKLELLKKKLMQDYFG